MVQLGRGLVLFALALFFAPAARAELFILANDSQLRGELLNPDEIPRLTYVIRTEQGEVTLDKKQVVKVVKESAARVEYEESRATYPDTVEGQWRLAEWCREKKLSDVRETHLRRIIELDPEHEQARRALGYIRDGEGWTTQAEQMTARGYVYYRGKWTLPQQIQLTEEREAAEQAELDWKQKIGKWRKLLNKDDKIEAARQAIVSIQDPAAVKPLADKLAEEEQPEVRLMYQEALGNIATGYALVILVDRSLEDPDEEVRLSALDELVKHAHPDMTDRYVKALAHKENKMINRAAIALGRLKDPSAVGPLIEALETVHKQTVQIRGGGMGASFDKNGGGGSFQAGPSFRTFKQQIRNEAVRDALVIITGINHHFDIDAWRHWHVTQRKDHLVNGRRD